MWTVNWCGSNSTDKTAAGLYEIEEINEQVNDMRERGELATLVEKVGERARLLIQRAAGMDNQFKCLRVACQVLLDNLVVGETKDFIVPRWAIEDLRKVLGPSTGAEFVASVEQGAAEIGREEDRK